MRELSVKEILKAVGGELIFGCGTGKINHVCLDSRECKEGDMFFAMVGTASDGHKYLGQVLEKGAKVICISEKKVIDTLNPGKNVDIILVKNTLKALQDLASYYLDLMPLKHRIAVTGSVGKTSTRDFTYYVMKTKYKTARNKKNFNSETGVPLTIFDFDLDTQVAVIEMGINEQGTVEDLVELVKPDMAVMTNIGVSHIERFPKEGRLGILKGKLHVTDNFNKDSVLVINNDCDMLSSNFVKNKFHPVTVGTTNEAEFMVSDVKDYGDEGISYTLHYDGKKYDIKLPVPGAHNAVNASLALAMGVKMGISIEDGIKGLNDAELTGKRLKISEIKGIKVIDDTYNAAPQSVKSAINTLMAIKTKGRHVAVLGDMLELGFESAAGHKEVGRHSALKGVDLTIGVCAQSKNILTGWLDENKEAVKTRDNPLTYENKETGKTCMWFSKREDLDKVISKILKSGDCVLFKASNAIKMDQVINNI